MSGDPVTGGGEGRREGRGGEGREGRGGRGGEGKICLSMLPD